MSLYGQQQRSNQDKLMTEEQFNNILDAILEGKYSWACVLILRTAGYNPLHYIPYRTYNRLMKDNCPTKLQKQRQRNEAGTSKQKTLTSKLSNIYSQSTTSTIRNLSYLESLDKGELKTSGGWKNYNYWELFAIDIS